MHTIFHCFHKGLGMAGLNFVGNAKYYDVDEDKENVAQYEFINYILSQCASVLDADDKSPGKPKAPIPLLY